MITRAMSLEKLEQLRKSKPAIYAAIEMMYQSEQYSKLERQLIHELRNLGNWQLEAACSWFEYDLMRAPHEVAYLESVILNWDRIPPTERPTMDKGASESRLHSLKEEITWKENEVQKARRGGYLWSIVPLLEYFALPEEERTGTSYYPLLPFFMKKAYEVMQNPRKPKPSLMERLKRFRIGISPNGGEAEIEMQDSRFSDGR